MGNKLGCAAMCVPRSQTEDFLIDPFNTEPAPISSSPLFQRRMMG